MGTTQESKHTCSLERPSLSVEPVALQFEHSLGGKLSSGGTMLIWPGLPLGFRIRRNHCMTGHLKDGVD